MKTGIFQIDPVWFEDCSIEVNIVLSKRHFKIETSDKPNCYKQNVFYIWGLQKKMISFTVCVSFFCLFLSCLIIKNHVCDYLSVTLVLDHIKSISISKQIGT